MAQYSTSGYLSHLFANISWTAEQDGVYTVVSYKWNINKTYGSVAGFGSGYPSCGIYIRIDGTAVNPNAGRNTDWFYASDSQRSGSGTIRIKRDLATNTYNLQCEIANTSGWTSYYSTDEPKGTPAYTQTLSAGSRSDSWTLGSTTTYGTGAQIDSVIWATDDETPVIEYHYDHGTSVVSSVVEACISFNGTTDNIPYRAIEPYGSTYTFTLTDDDKAILYTLLAKGKTATVIFRLRTLETLDSGEITPIYSDYSKTIEFVNYAPFLNPTIVDTNPATIAVTGDANKLVKYVSKASYNMNVELRKGASDVIGCYIQNGDKIEEGLLEGTFDNPTSNTFYFSVTDDRGYTSTHMYSLSSFDGEFIEYIKPTASIKAEAITGEGNLNFVVSGKYFDKYFSSTNKNEMSIKYAVYPVHGTPTWATRTNIEPTMDGADYSYSISVSGLDYTKAHTIEVQVIDKLLTATATITAVARPVFYWSKDEFFFNVPVSINEATVDSVIEEKSVTAYYINSSGNSSSTGVSWNYRKWTSGLVECWCSVPLTITLNTGWGNMYVAATQYKTDLSYPIQLTGTPFVMVTIGAGATKGMVISDSSYAADNVSTGRYNIASPVAITSNTTFRLNYYVRGKWQ